MSTAMVIVDLAETEPAAGVTMIPLNGAPASLTLASDTYPVASKDGHVTYKQDASFDALSRQMAGTFSGRGSRARQARRFHPWHCRRYLASRFGRVLTRCAGAGHAPDRLRKACTDQVSAGF